MTAMKFVLICCLVAFAAAGGAPAPATNPRLEAVTASAGTPRAMSVFMRDIFTDELAIDTIGGTGQPVRIWGAPKDAPGGLPFSATVLYLFWSVSAILAVQPAPIVDNTGTEFVLSTTGVLGGTVFNTLTFSWDQVMPLAARVDMKWESGNLEIDPFDGCTGSGPSGDCRCNALDTDRTHQYMVDDITGGTDSMDASTINSPNPPFTGNADGTFTVNLEGVLPTYFDHAPFAGQNPFLRTYRRLCLRWSVGGGAPAMRWFDTNVMIAVTQPCIDQAINDGTLPTDIPGLVPTTLSTNFQCANKVNLFTYLFATSGSAAPLLANTPPTTGLQPGLLGGFFEPFFQTVAKDERDETQDVGNAFGETVAMMQDRYSRTTCCGYSGNFGATAGAITGVGSNGDVTAYSPGVCIDAITSGATSGSTTGSKARCCGRRPYNPLAEQCCSKPSSTVRWLDQPCPCFTAAQYTNLLSGPVAIDPCSFMFPNADDVHGVSTVDRTAGLGDARNSGWTCCTPTKWGVNSVQQPPFATGGTGVTSTFVATGLTPTVGINSFCVNPTVDPRWQCCDDGNVYDVGTAQCCPINGVQSVNSPCPCGVDTDCPGYPSQLCCSQTFPTPVALPHVTNSNPVTCSKFANWPRQQQQLQTSQDFLDNTPIPAQLQRCPGKCYHTEYQICCNGRTCLQNFERCCNDTCCNHYTESCMIGRRPGAWGNRWNPREWSVYYETCSQLEYLNGRKAFFVFVLPSILLFATLLSLAFVTILARRATEHIFELTERAMVFCAVVSVFLSCTYYFSPIYKNGVAIAFVSLGAILIAVARKRAASLFLVIVLFFLILYVIDPFSGNIYLSLTSHMPVRGAPKSSSLLEAALNMWVHNDRCTYYYQWFIHDNTLRDFERYDNPAQLTWGFCSRAWVTALMIFALMLYVLLLLLLLLSIFSLVKKLGVKDVEPIELEIAYDDGAPFAPAPPAPYYVG